MFESKLNISIVSGGGKVASKVTNDITYLTESGLDEFRKTTSKNEVFFSLNKLKLRYKPKVDIDISYDALLKINFRFFDPYAGLEFKMKKGDLIIKPGLTAHFYRWQVSQFSKEIVHSYKNTLLPALMLKYEINASEKLNFNYNLKSGFSDASSYASRLRLVGFNRLFRGNETLENTLSHALSLRYSKFNMYHGIFVNGSINYTRKVNSIRSTNIIEGIDQISSLFYTSIPEDSYFGNASIAKQTRKLKFQDFSIFESNNFSNRFTQVEPFAILDYDFLNDFILKADYSYHYYQNKGNNKSNRFALGNASLFYNKEDRPWSFEIDVKNAFDVRYKNSNSLSEYLITDQRTYIQPRTVLFKISYKL